eukprot:TsM_000595100 transcript=TsM_000595100 gene=TsM_000595100
MLDKQRRTKKKGLVPKVKSPLYKLKLARIEVVFQDEDPSELEIREGRCFLGSEVWGEPCQRSGDSALITLNDVSKQDELFITTGGEVDLQTSFPLSRFGRGQPHVELKFGIQGAKRKSWVHNTLDAYHTSFVPFTLSHNPFLLHRYCDLVKDKVTNLRIFAVNVSRIGKARYDIFTWYGRRTDVTVTVDWTQEGDSTDTWTEW